MDKQLIRRLLHRPPDTNKYDFGHLLVVGGSTGMTGAPLLAAEAALRIGCGIVTVATDKLTARDLTGKVNEVMSIPLPPDAPKAETMLKEYIAQHKVTALVIGPGLQPLTSDLVRRLVESIRLPLVVDAGGLSAFGGHLDELREAATHNPSIVITPHTGEYERIAGVSKKADLRADAQNFSVEVGIHVVLKGQHTLVAHPVDAPYRNNTGNPGLATAGSGDVLAGIIGGLLAQKIEAGKAAEAAVYLHGLSADIAVQDKTEAGIIASDVIAYLPQAIKKSE